MKDFSREELLRRACLRVAMVIRGMWEEKRSSDTRLLDPPMIPNHLVIVGRSLAYDGTGRREHVVPRAVIIDECHAMLARGATDEAIAEFIQRHNCIVLVTDEEARRMDRADALGMRQTMPKDWQFGDGLYSRLELAEIAWEPFTLQAPAIARKKAAAQ